MDMENVDEDTVFGAGHIEDFSWKQLLDLYSCTECGRCQDACPAWTTGKPLSPKLLIMGLRDNLFESAPTARADPGALRAQEGGCVQRRGERRGGEAAGGAKAEAPTLVPGTIEPDVLWSCLTCGACVEECPVDIEHVDTIVDMRRHQVLMESEFPSEAGLMLRNLENQGDPWGLGASKRTDWTSGARLRGAGRRRRDPRRRRVPLLGRLRRSPRRAGTEGDAGDGADAPRSRCQVRDPRTTRVVHR